MMTAWKCYRCNLEFKEKIHAEMHHQITKHSARPVELIRV